jgi:phage-related protein
MKPLSQAFEPGSGFFEDSEKHKHLLAYVPDSGHNKIVKPIDFHGRTLEFIRLQATSTRRQIGEALRDLQKGVHLGMPLSRPMPMVASGVHELRIRGEGTTVRVLYYVRKADAIVVFHAFQKKSQKTPSREIDLARQRLQEVLNEAGKS